MPDTPAMTIGALARAADVNVEAGDASLPCPILEAFRGGPAFP